MPDSFASRLARHPRYQQAMQRRLATRPEVAAVPDTGDITQAYAGDMARTELEGTRHAGAMELGRERLDLGRGQLDLGRERLELTKDIHTEGMGLTRASQDVARSQGRFATGIGIANLGLQGLAGIVKIQDANMQAQAFDEQNNLILERIKTAKTDDERAQGKKELSGLRFLQLWMQGR